MAMKTTYRIGDIASMLEVRPSVIRYWETEFPELQPERLPSGQRLFTKEDLKLLLRIKDLLYTRGLTIEGARQALSRARTSAHQHEPVDREFEIHKEKLEEKRKDRADKRRARLARKQQDSITLLEDVVQELQDIRALLTAPLPPIPGARPVAAAAAHPSRDASSRRPQLEPLQAAEPLATAPASYEPSPLFSALVPLESLSKENLEGVGGEEMEEGPGQPKEHGPGLSF